MELNKLTADLHWHVCHLLRIKRELKARREELSQICLNDKQFTAPLDLANAIGQIDNAVDEVNKAFCKLI